MFKILSFKPDWVIDVDYDTQRDCESNGCDYICRCSRIVNVVIESINVDIDTFKFQNGKGYKSKKDLSDIDKYCIARLMVIHGAYNQEYYEPCITGGYYGEEVTGFDFENELQLIDDVEQMLNMTSDIEKVHFVLEKEYSFIAPIVSNATTVNVADISLKDISPSNGMTMLKKQTSYVYDTLKKDKIFGIVKECNGKYVIIDGNHRYSLLCNHISDPPQTFKYIVIE